MAPDSLGLSYDGAEARRVYAASKSHWQKADRRAKALAGVAAPTSLDIQSVLHRTPALPDTIPNTDSISGFTTWQGLSTKCHQKMKDEAEEMFYLRGPYQITVSLSRSQDFANWNGTPYNGVALLVLGWAYVFSASLAERQSLSMEYGSISNGCLPPLHTVGLEYATPDERLWWKAVTTQGVGWSIAGGQIAPWAVRIEDIGLAIADANEANDAKYGDGDYDADTLPTPPTAQQAAYYIARLCAFYQLGSQNSAALAAVVTLPLHTTQFICQPSMISLPRPRLPLRASAFDTRQLDCGLPKELSHLGYYMALSLSYRILGSALWSVFWAPDVPCNLAGAWLQPAAFFLKPILDDDVAGLERLAKLLSFTRAAPLWLGVALCGRGHVVESILPWLTRLSLNAHSTPNITAAAWTGLESSFLHVHPRTPPYIPGRKVSRAQVWRLRHDFYALYPADEGFCFQPEHGWPPFGEMNEEDVELEIRNHLACDHRWTYRCWTWLLRGEGSAVVRVMDKGFSAGESKPTSAKRCTTARTPRLAISKAGWNNIRMLSKKATESIFQWSYSQVERGFSHIVQPLPGDGMAEEPQSPRQSNLFNPSSVLAWRDQVVTVGPSKVDRA